MQALVAFLGDSPDVAVVEDVAVSMAGMLQPASYLRPALITSLQAKLRNQCIIICTKMTNTLNTPDPINCTPSLLLLRWRQ